MFFSQHPYIYRVYMRVYRISHTVFMMCNGMNTEIQGIIPHVYTVLVFSQHIYIAYIYPAQHIQHIYTQTCTNNFVNSTLRHIYRIQLPILTVYDPKEGSCTEHFIHRARTFQIIKALSSLKSSILSLQIPSSSTRGGVGRSI